MNASMISPYISREAPVTMSVEVSSSSALVISAPGTRIATGAHTANSGTGPRSSQPATAPTSRVDTNADTKGATAAAARTRSISIVSPPTSSPTTSASATAHHGQRYSHARDSDSSPHPITLCRPGWCRGVARIDAIRAGAAANGTAPDSSPCTSLLALADCRNVRTSPLPITVVVADDAPGRLTITISGRIANS